MVLQKLRRDKVSAFGFIDIVNRADVGMEKSSEFKTLH
jgi:hypothetical protein